MDAPTPALHVTRRLNLLQLLKDFAHTRLSTSGEMVGAEAAFALAVGMSASMLSQIKKHRPIGTKVARQIESSLGLTPGWLDIERIHASVPTPQEIKFHKLAARIWSEGTAKQKRAAVTALMGILQSS